MSLGKSSVHTRKGKLLAKTHAGRDHGSAVPALDERTLPFQQPMQTPVLVLNASYEPINICGARRALVLVLKGVAKTEEEQGMTLHAARVRMPLPLVIRLPEKRSRLR